MANPTAGFRKTEPGKAITSVILAGAKTPKAYVKFCNLFSPFYYPNSPAVSRFSITLILNPDVHGDFIKTIQTVERNEGVSTVLREEITRNPESTEIVTTGNWLLKFQNRNKIPTKISKTGEKAQDIVLDKELPYGTQVIVCYDIVRYSKPNSVEKGISFRPTLVYINEDGAKPTYLEQMEAK